MQLHKNSCYLISWIIIAISLFVFVFLALLNNRYMYLGSSIVLDKWSGKSYIPKHKTPAQEKMPASRDLEEKKEYPVDTQP